MDTRAGSITIRDATAEDVAFLAWVMLTAARSHLPRGLWEYIYDIGEAEALRFLECLAVTDEVHFCHHSLFSIAEVDAEPAAALCGFDPTVHGMSALGPVLPGASVGAGLSLDDLPSILERGATVSAVNAPYEPGAWVIENVATRPEFRRRGLVDALVSSMLERGRAQGFGIGQIGVLIGNDPARNAYVKRGFVPTDERRDRGFEAGMGCPGIERLLMRFPDAD